MGLHIIATEISRIFKKIDIFIFIFVAFAVAHFKDNFAAFSNEFDPSL